MSLFVEKNPKNINKNKNNNKKTTNNAAKNQS